MGRSQRHVREVHNFYNDVPDSAGDTYSEAGGVPPIPVAPTSITPTTFTIAEGASGRLLGILHANGNPVPTFSEVLDSGNRVSIAANGVVTMTAEYDYEAPLTSFTFTARATNSQGTFDQVVTVTVTDISDTTPEPSTPVTFFYLGF